MMQVTENGRIPSEQGSTSYRSAGDDHHQSAFAKDEENLWEPPLQEEAPESRKNSTKQEKDVRLHQRRCGLRRLFPDIGENITNDCADETKTFAEAVACCDWIRTAAFTPLYQNQVRDPRECLSYLGICNFELARAQKSMEEDLVWSTGLSREHVDGADGGGTSGGGSQASNSRLIGQSNPSVIDHCETELTQRLK